jgi:hypothetical protein
VFEEFIAQGKDMIRRQEKQIGENPYAETRIPVYERVTRIEANAWRETLEKRIRTNFGPDAYARYRVFWDVYEDEVAKKQGDESTRCVNLWQRIVAYLVELDWRLGTSREDGMDTHNNGEIRKVG